jgi:signal transduction histidine kinase
MVIERRRWLAIAIPIVLIGVVELFSDSLLDSVLPFPWDTLAVMAVVLISWGVVATIALRRIDALAATVEARNSELERRIATARVLHRVSVAIAGMGDIAPILQTIVEQARALLQADAAVLLLAGSDDELRFAAGDGAVERTGSGPGSDAARWLDGSVTGAHLAAPLQRGGRTIGMLVVGCVTERTFGVDDVEALSSLANEVALALENSRLQSRLRELAMVEERERIAREMHDGLAQILGYVNTKSQAVESLLDDGRTDEARRQVAELAAAARSLYVDVREAILGLRSPVPPDAGLVGAIEDYAAGFAAASKLAVVVEATEDARAIDLPPDVEAQLFRIVQESLTNVRKHAVARRVAITLRVHDERLVIELIDDGHGFPQEAPATEGWPHYGLEAMRERATAVGGTIEWRDGPDGGAVVHVETPFAGSAVTVRAPGAA